MNRKLNGIVVAVVLAIIGTFLLVGYVSSAEARATKGEKLVPVLVVQSAIRAGTDVDHIGDAVAIEQVPSKVRARGALDSLDDVDGVTAVALVPGEQLLADRFVDPAVEARGNVPEGLYEVTLSLDPERALGGRIAPGHQVGVVASFDDTTTGASTTSLLVDHVLVTGVQATDPPDDTEDGEKIGPAPESALLVTLALDQADLERVVGASEHGTVWLSSSPVESGR
jgi:pilus assembly protein CpaB